MDRFASFDGVEIAYHTWGTAGELPPVILHHGFIANANVNWVLPGIVTALTNAGRQVVALDARGHGDSGKPHDPVFYGEEKMVQDLRRLFDSVGASRVDLVGYSMGAIVSLIAASQDERIRRLVVGGVGAGVVELGGVDTRLSPEPLSSLLCKPRTPAPSRIRWPWRSAPSPIELEQTVRRLPLMRVLCARGKSPCARLPLRHWSSPGTMTLSLPGPRYSLPPFPTPVPCSFPEIISASC